MATKTVLLIIMNITITVVLIALVFKSFKNFKKSIYYFLYPDIASIVKKDYNNDFTYTHKLLFVLVVLFVTVLIELQLFY